MPQPIFPPPALQNSANVSSPKITLDSNIPRYRTRDGNDYYYLNAVQGIPTFQYLDILANAFGLDKLYALKDFPWMKDRMKAVSAMTLRRKLGSELRPRGVVIRTNSPDGSGLGVIEIDVAFEGGTGGEFFSMGHELISKSGRNFEIINNPTLVNGAQRVQLVPRDGVADLVVSGGQSRDFLNNSTFGHLAVNKYPGRCGQVFNDYVTTPDEYEACRLSTVTYTTTRDAMTLQNEAAFSQPILANIGVVDDSGAEARIPLFILASEQQSAVRAAQQMYSAFWWGQANQASALGSQSIAGNGVYHSIDPQYRYVWPASVYSTPEGLSKILDFFYDVNPTAKDTPPIFYQGYSANQATMKTLDAANARQFFEPPYKNQGDGEGYWFNEPVYEGYRNFAGYAVKFKHIPAFDSAVSSGDLDPKSPNRGLRSWATIGLDMGRMQNINPETSQYEAEGDQLGSFKVNTYCGKTLITGRELFYQDIVIRGATNEFGEAITNGEAGALGMDEIHRRTQSYTFGVEVTPGAGISIEIAA